MRSSSAFVAIGLLLVSAAGCSGDSVTEDRNLDPALFNDDGFAVVDAEDAFANVEAATLDGDMRMNPVFDGGGGFLRHRRHPGGPGSHLAPVLMRLGLDETQRFVIREFIRAHREQVRPILEGLREANADLIDSANEERRAVLDALRAGDITLEEAKDQLRAISDRTREAIRTNPANEPFLEQICDARKTLFEDIRSILTDSQVDTWDGWVAGLDDDCP